VSTISDNEKYMQRCLELAKMGQGNTGANPMVGAVIVHNGRIIGEGYHKKYGEWHAEVNAINAVKDKNLLCKSTLYVNLEPCSHLGKTPPCSELIIANNIPCVVVGSIDPNSIVAGKGLEKLRSSGTEVITGIMEKEAVELNRRFFSYYKRKRPYIILKWAQTTDGFIDIEREKKQAGNLLWISNNISKMLVHKWRAEEHAIMVGTNTALLDNPHLNIRLWNGNDPLRVVPDRKLRLPSKLHIFNKTQKTIVFTANKTAPNDNPEYVSINFNGNALEEMLTVLYNKEIQSLFVEGGRMLIDSFIEKNLWDEARVFVGDIKFKKGIEAPSIPLEPIKDTYIENDRLLVFRNFNPS
jgi:diaminohydroxyphosphoribosylaminopyrimidine deaminase/5-amino-6-(5-phosphoribosylamino)uracil reductase